MSKIKDKLELEGTILFYKTGLKIEKSCRKFVKFVYDKTNDEQDKKFFKQGLDMIDRNLEDTFDGLTELLAEKYL